MNRTLRAALLGTFASLASADAALQPDPPHACEYCEGWSRPHEPFKVYGNTWYVGSALSSILITSKQGHILIDGGLTQTAPQIAANIRKLGFRLEDVKLILNSHMHYDHAGGIAALQRASGARVAASPAARRALEAGEVMADDPQFAFGKEHNEFPAVKDVREVADGQELSVGKLRITAHFTPGHTPGGTSWTWTSCEGATCLSMVYADSLNSVSAHMAAGLPAAGGTAGRWSSFNTASNWSSIRIVFHSSRGTGASWVPVIFPRMPISSNAVKSSAPSVVPRTSAAPGAGHAFVS